MGFSPCRIYQVCEKCSYRHIQVAFPSCVLKITELDTQPSVTWREFAGGALPGDVSQGMLPMEHCLKRVFLPMNTLDAQEFHIVGQKNLLLWSNSVNLYRFLKVFLYIGLYMVWIHHGWFLPFVPIYPISENTCFNVRCCQASVSNCYKVYKKINTKGNSNWNRNDRVLTMKFPSWLKSTKK